MVCSYINYNSAFLLRAGAENYAAAVNMAVDSVAPAIEPGSDEEAALLGLAIANYERFHSMPAGSATAAQVEATSAGVVGWAADSGDPAGGPPREGVPGAA